MAFSKPPNKPELRLSRAAFLRACGNDRSPLLNDDLFQGLDEVLNYIHMLEQRIVELEKSAAAVQTPAP